MMPAMFNLTGKVALVTGAAQGLGRAMALALAEAGADTFLVDRNDSGAAETSATIQKLGRRALAAKCDVSDPAQIRSLFQRLDAEFGHLDFLGNVAGDAIPGPPEEFPLDEVGPSGRILVLALFSLGREPGRPIPPPGRAGILTTVSSPASPPSAVVTLP